MNTLLDAFEHNLRDIFWAKKALFKALPKFEDAITLPALREAFLSHRNETETHITRLDAVFGAIGRKPASARCEAMAGLLKEADRLLHSSKGPARDAALIGAAQAIEHYEIARYGTLRAWAKELGLDRAYRMLSDILDEEKAANARLNALALHDVNLRPSAAV